MPEALHYLHSYFAIYTKGLIMSKLKELIDTYEFEIFTLFISLSGVLFFISVTWSLL